jgi:hypothetical protein
MSKYIHFHYVSVYYKDIHHFISEVFEFVRDFYFIVDNNEHFYDQKKFEKLNLDEIHLHHTTPIFLTPLPLSYLINSYETEEELMERIGKDILELHSKMNKSNETIVLTLSTELFPPNETEFEVEIKYPEDYYYIFQVNSKNYQSDEEFREKIKVYIDNYFNNYNEFLHLKPEDLTDVENGIKYEGDDISYSGNNRFLLYNLTDYPSAEKHYENVIQSLEEIKSENLPDDCSIIVRLSYTLLPF